MIEKQRRMKLPKRVTNSQAYITSPQESVVRIFADSKALTKNMKPVNPTKPPRTRERERVTEIYKVPKQTKPNLPLHLKWTDTDSYQVKKQKLRIDFSFYSNSDMNIIQIFHKAQPL